MTRGRKQIIIGEVVSDKMEKTVLVRVERKIPHPVYKKYVKKSPIANELAATYIDIYNKY